jgi:hypothetical protein
VEKDGDGIGLLARRASRHPHSDLLVRRCSVDDVRDDPLLQRRERLIVAEEPRYADEEVFVEGTQLARVVAKLLDVPVDVE